MSLPSIVSYGSGAKTSSLVWDSDLTIPDGYAIDSASGEVGIIGDVSISGSVSADGDISSSGDVTAGENLVGINVDLSGKQLVFGENVGNASVTLAQPGQSKKYTSPDFTITNNFPYVQYVVPALTYQWNSGYVGNATFNLQAKLNNGTYQTISSVTVRYDGSGSTQSVISPAGMTALRYTITSTTPVESNSITPLTMTLTPLAVY